MKVTKILAGFLALACACAFAQEIAESEVDNCYIRLGLTYRKFDKVSFKSPAIGGYSGFYLLNVGESGLTDISAITTVGTGNSVYGTTGQTGHAEYVRIVDVTGGSYKGKGDWGTGDRTGLVIGLGFPLSDVDGIKVDFVTNFMYFNMDTATRRGYASGFRGSSYDSIVQNGVATASGVWGQVYDSAAGVSDGYYRARFSMDMYQLDFGARFGFDLGNGLAINACFGPTFAITDVDSSCYGGGAGSNVIGKDGRTQLVCGAYASLGASFWFSEQVGLNFDLRYDEGFKHATTKYANLDTDSFSGLLSLMVHF